VDLDAIDPQPHRAFRRRRERGIGQLNQAPTVWFRPLILKVGTAVAVISSFGGAESTHHHEKSSGSAIEGLT
jgi:hypothetical protein